MIAIPALNDGLFPGKTGGIIPINLAMHRDVLMGSGNVFRFRQTGSKGAFLPSCQKTMAVKAYRKFPIASSIMLKSFYDSFGFLHCAFSAKA